MARVFQRSGSTWWLDYKDPVDGQRKRVSTKVKTKAAAQALLAELLQARKEAVVASVLVQPRKEG